MVGRTHDLAAFTALSFIIAIHPLPGISYGTAIVAFGANMIGGLTPDIDQPTASLWHKIPAGTIIGKLISPFLGGHRFISHSILGIVLFGVIANYALQLMHHTLVVDIPIVWWSFMIGYISHLVMDTFTKDGVPWLFPIPMRIGIPPFAFLRIKTGGFMEKSIVFPALILCNIYIYYVYRPAFLTFFHHYIK